MKYRILGRTGIRVSAVALGCEGFMGKTTAEVVSDFDYATELGINFVDIYSPNPELRINIGAAIAGRRNDFVIQGHLCTVWEDGQYLRTRDADKTSPRRRAPFPKRSASTTARSKSMRRTALRAEPASSVARSEWR